MARVKAAPAQVFEANNSSGLARGCLVKYSAYMAMCYNLSLVLTLNLDYWLELEIVHFC